MENYIVEQAGILKAKEFDSSNLASIRYAQEEDILEVEFSRGGTYQYKGVPLNVFIDFANAESKGKFFQSNISKVYQYRKL